MKSRAPHKWWGSSAKGAWVSGAAWALCTEELAHLALPAHCWESDSDRLVAPTCTGGCSSGDLELPHSNKPSSLQWACSLCLFIDLWDSMPWAQHPDLPNGLSPTVPALGPYAFTFSSLDRTQPPGPQPRTGRYTCGPIRTLWALRSPVPSDSLSPRSNPCRGSQP